MQRHKKTQICVTGPQCVKTLHCTLAVQPQKLHTTQHTNTEPHYLVSVLYTFSDNYISIWGTGRCEMKATVPTYIIQGGTKRTHIIKKMVTVCILLSIAFLLDGKNVMFNDPLLHDY
jgi:hypothetical protein